jgi:parvulin-like peptidyl-prolyl isomerase
LDKKDGNGKADRLNSIEDKRRLPVFVKYTLIAVVIVAVIVIGIFAYINIAGGYVATVDGQKIKTGEYKYYFEMQKQSMLYSAQEQDPNITEDTFWTTKIGGENVLDVAKQKALDAARDAEIQYMKAKEAKISLTSDEIKYIDDNIQTSIIDSVDPQNTSGGTGNKIRANKAFIAQYGFSLDDVRDVQLKNYTIRKFVSSEVQKIADKDADVETYYKKNPEWFKEDTSYRIGAEEAVWVKHILIKAASTATQEEKDAAKKKAEDIIAQLKGGADFATLAKEKSEDGSSSWGGDYLFGKNQMYTEFETAAFALSPGQVTETPVLTDAGYHIIKLEEKYAKDEPASLRCAKEYNEYGTTFIKYKLYTQKMDEWSKNAKVKKNDAVYNSLK